MDMLKICAKVAGFFGGSLLRKITRFLFALTTYWHSVHRAGLSDNLQKALKHRSCAQFFYQVAGVDSLGRCKLVPLSDGDTWMGIPVSSHGTEQDCLMGRIGYRQTEDYNHVLVVFGPIVAIQS